MCYVVRVTGCVSVLVTDTIALICHFKVFKNQTKTSFERHMFDIMIEATATIFVTVGIARRTDWDSLHNDINIYIYAIDINNIIIGTCSYQMYS